MSPIIYGGGGSSGGGSTPVSVATVPVSSAELKNLLASPKSIVASPGPNKTLLVLSALVYYVFNTTPYTTPDGDTLWLTNGNLCQVNLGAIYGANQDAACYVAGGQPPDPAGEPTAEFAPYFVDTPIRLENFGAGNVTVGDGTLRVTVYYATLNIP